MEDIHLVNENKRLRLLACKELPYDDQMYKLIDFLNKNLKDRNIILGLSKKNDNMLISLYTEK